MKILITEQQLNNLTDNINNTNSPQFKQWFANSKVVDKNGNPLILYHGTKSSDGFNVFSNSKDIGYHFAVSKHIANDMSGYNTPR